MPASRTVRSCALALGVFSCTTALAAPGPCPGDINDDGLTNAADFTILAGNFGGSVTPNTSGDLNGDGAVNAADFTILAGAFGCRIETVRVMTWNVEDVRTEHLTVSNNPKMQEVAEVIQILAPDILLLNEIAYDQPGEVIGAPGPGLNGQRFADNYLAVSQNGQTPIAYTAIMFPSNTGIHSCTVSCQDLDNDGVIDPTPFSFDYGVDCFGFGDYPGQYAMTVLVRSDLTVLTAQIRTFQNMLWNLMPGYLAATLVNPPFLGGGPYYTPAELAILRLSSKSHWDVPIVMPDGSTLHLLASHPTPPVFDGLEDRNGRRNHDEIRFWADYIDGDAYFLDDNAASGGLSPGAQFVIVGDLNADPDEGEGYNNPIGTYFQANPAIQFITPLANLDLTAFGRDNDDTAFFNLRADYALPSAGLTVRATGIERIAGAFTPTDGPSDHWPVWVDLDFTAN
jgi:endonuclease/exonuclease/phosphatase family metal-dependent hydrolase